MLISPLPPPEGGIATWTLGYQKYCFARKDTDLRVVNTALIGRRARKINDGRSIKDEIYRTFGILKQIKKQLADYQPDIIHLNSSCGKFGLFRDYLILNILSKRKLPIILQLHCNVGDTIGKSNVRKRVLRQMVRTAARALVLNDESKQFISNEIKSDVCCIPNFIEMESDRKHSKVCGELSKVIYIGHVQKNKATQEISEAARQFPHI